MSVLYKNNILGWYQSTLVTLKQVATLEAIWLSELDKKNKQTWLGQLLSRHNQFQGTKQNNYPIKERWGVMFNCGIVPEMETNVNVVIAHTKK